MLRRPSNRTGYGSHIAIVALVLVSLMGGAFLAEWGFRLVSGEQVELHGMYTGDETIGVGLTPGFVGAVRTAEFEHSVSVNELGMRDAPVGPKHPGLDRVLVLGDSFVFGVGVDVEDSLPKALLRRVQELDPSLRVEVLNAGVPGYSPWQELKTLVKLAPAVAPDLVVQVIFMGDDWYGNVRRIPPDQAHRDVTEWLRVQSALFRFVDRFVLSRFKGGDHYEPHRVRPTPEFARRVDFVMTILEETRDVAAASGADFLVVLCPRFTQVYEDAWSKANLVYGLPAEEYDPLEPNRSFGERLRSSGFAVIDLLAPMRDEGRRRSLHFPVDGHWNREGTAFAAEIIAPTIAARLRGQPKEEADARAER